MEVKGYSHILNDIYFVTNNYKDILEKDFPEKFVLKCNHGAGYNIVHHGGPVDKKYYAKQLKKWMKEDYGKNNAEIHYSKIPRKIICEKYLEDESNKFPIDYKLFCFNGKVELISPRTEREDGLKIFYFDRSWEKVKYIKQPKTNRIPNKPKKLEKMIQIAEDLSKDFYFVRLDFYIVDNKIFFGEFTFTPTGGFTKAFDSDTQLLLGSMINLDGIK